jgi:hypothetical protein
LEKLFKRFQPDELFIDAFPRGIVGEFSNLKFDPKLKINYVARLLNWTSYNAYLKGRGPYFDKTFILEPLEHSHLEWIKNNSTQIIENFKLNYPVDGVDAEMIENIIMRHSPFWIIVHSEPNKEIEYLISYAEQLREYEMAKVDLLLITPQKNFKAKIFCYDVYPVTPLFEHAEKIITTCGFNILQQTQLVRHKLHCIPFKRRFDNQFARLEMLS